jgi:hypothetical protein
MGPPQIFVGAEVLPSPARLTAVQAFVGEAIEPAQAHAGRCQINLLTCTASTTRGILAA